MLIKLKTQNSKVKSRIVLFVVTIAFFLLPIVSNAQCAMCRAALESEEGGVQAKAINDGIVYLMVIPYILVAVAAYAIYKIRSVKKDVKEE
ncbi:hypothetical protein [Flavobacterium sp. N2270]|uniref:hypothetical protein n=1 Tax=Flavobacterium sp. N2270 TaxID=2986831 RepID=UPI0022249FEF|nr:hypothetical protein [Flavobacterium sp. N2270]